MEILHVSADFPDPLAPAKTRAVANLLALAPDVRHCVYSLNRVGWRLGVAAMDFGADGRAIAYGAPPKGLMLRSRLARVADFIVEDATRRRLKPDVVHAHKLSIDGLVGAAVAAALGAPLIVSAQGDTDLKVIGARPDLRGVWSRIWRDARVALPFAPWTQARLDALLGTRTGPTMLLPCPTEQDALRPPRVVGPLFRTAFHLGVHRRKNAALLVEAAARAGRVEPGLRLDILGGGDPDAFARLSAVVAARGEGKVRLAGPAPHARMGEFMNESCAFALPSLRESFGMVFSEALLAGAPVLHPHGFAIDGYLPDGEATLAAPARDVAAVAEGLVRLAREETAFKTRLAGLQASGRLDMFRREAIARVYRDALACAAACAAARRDAEVPAAKERPS